MKFVSPYNPNILKMTTRNAPLRVFLCGPGYESARYNFRNNLRSFLDQHPNVETVLGEELNLTKHRLKAGDLQTIETAFAHTVDFTILILESPGAIAELATFSMMQNVRPRLFVMVPGRFFGSTSYIARGPLSVIGREHVNNIIYFDEDRQSESIHSLEMPITLFKYARAIDPFFREISTHGFYRSGRAENYYAKAFGKIKQKFTDLIVFVTILLLEGPTFPMIVSMTKLDPGDVKRSLGRLFKSKSIERAGGSRYKGRLGLTDPLLAPINTTFLSKLRASYLAAA